MPRQPRFSLHRGRTGHECQICGNYIPVDGEFWRVKGAPKNAPTLICCVCHWMFGYPTDGWETAPDGRIVMTASVPAAIEEAIDA